MLTVAAPDSRKRVVSLCVAMAAASVGLAIAVSGVYANAMVSAGTRGQCGTVWEPNAVTSACASALKERSWVAIGLLGASCFAAAGAVVIVGRSPQGHRRQLGVLAAIIGMVVIAGGLIWAGVIDRTIGT